MRNLEQWERVVLSDREHTICFSGHRPCNLPGYGNDIGLLTALRHAVEVEIQNGMRVFLNGGMAGFDVLAAEIVIALRQKHPHIKCVTVAPFRKEYFNNNNWTDEWKIRALTIYKASDIAFALAENYRRGIYYERDDYELDHSCGVICYYRGKITGTKGKIRKGGGTEYTVNRAYDLNMFINNISDKIKP